MTKRLLGVMIITLNAALLTELPYSDYSLIQRIVPVRYAGGILIKPWRASLYSEEVRRIK